MYLASLDQRLTTEQFEAGCRELFDGLRFWPTVDEIVEAARSVERRRMAPAHTKTEEPWNGPRRFWVALRFLKGSTRKVTCPGCGERAITQQKIDPACLEMMDEAQRRATWEVYPQGYDPATCLDCTRRRLSEE